MMKPTLLLATLILASQAFAASNEGLYSGLPRVNIGRTPTYVHENTVYLASRPLQEDLKIFTVLKVSTIIDLSGAMNAAAVEAFGLDYIAIPLHVGRPVRMEDAARVMDALAHASQRERVLVCDDDGELIGAVWALYRALTSGLDADDAVEEGRTVGLEDKKLVNNVRNLVALSMNR